MIELTPQQEHLYNYVPTADANTGAKANAGCGKSFIASIIAGAFPESKRILNVTFSKKLTEEAIASGKFPKNCDHKTAHGLAYASAKKYYSPSSKLNVHDYFRNEALFEYLAEPLFAESTYEDDDDKRMMYEMRSTFLDLVNYCKVNMVDPKNLFEVEEVISYYGVAVGVEKPTMIKCLMKAFDFSMLKSSTINFVEMIHTPVMLDLPFPQYDVILADEVQDSSVMMMELYKKCLAPGGKIFIVGDPNQAIYGFAGSRNESMDIISNKFDCEIYPLSVNFRCGKSHIQLAQSIVPDIQWHDGADDGEITRTDEFDPDKLNSGDLVLCRTNAPLVGPCLKLVKEGKKANIMGKDIAGPINTILKKLKGKEKQEALERLVSMEESEIRVAEKRKYKKASIDMIMDRFSIAKSFLDESDSVEEAIRKLYAIFKDDKSDGIVFSSIHKAKGLEADNVTILNADMIRMSKDDMLPWQHAQEANLEYVAYTRPKKTLTLISQPKK